MNKGIISCFIWVAISMLPVLCIAQEADTTVYTSVERMPRFPGCEDMDMTEVEKFQCAQVKMLYYLYGNIQYPAKARMNRTEGTVAVQFIVETDGSLSQIECLRDIGHGCGKEAVRVIKSMNKLPEKWVPGLQQGVPVRVRYTLPVNYKLH